MEPLHSPVATPVVEQQLVSMQAVSVNGQICTAQTAADAEREVHRRHQGSRLAGRTLKLLDGPEGSLWSAIWKKVKLFIDLPAIGTVASFRPWAAEELPVEFVSSDAPICQEQAGMDGRRESLPQLPELLTGKMNPQSKHRAGKKGAFQKLFVSCILEIAGLEVI